MTTTEKTTPPRSKRRLCLPIIQEEYPQIIDDPIKTRQWIDACYATMPELFPEAFVHGYRMKDIRISRKQNLKIRRIRLRHDNISYTVYPSFLMPYATAYTDDVEPALFLRSFGVPYWALARVFGRNHTFWFRLEMQFGRYSLVGTTARKTPLPQHLLADEHHQSRQGSMNYIATTVGAGCCLGAEVSESADQAGLMKAYGVFKKEAQDSQPDYTPETVNTDGWASTQAAWLALFPKVIILQCFLHGWLKIRQCGKRLKAVFHELSDKVWKAYHSPDKRHFSQRLRRLREWGQKHLQGTVQEKVEALCKKRERWLIAYEYPEGHRTSNMLDRVMRSMNRYFDQGLHLHGSLETATQHSRAWALLYNFTPWHPQTCQDNEGWQSPAERLNQHRYHENWLQNLLISASLDGYSRVPPNP